jgi:type I restriction enzyme M protein
MPDLQGVAAAEVCTDLMQKCRVHTILRLPTGIFYAPSVKANVLFFTRGKTGNANTNDVWVYDLRATMPAFGKHNRFTREHLADFEKVYGADPHGNAPREQSERFRRVTREEIKLRGDILDLSWLRDDNKLAHVNLPRPQTLLAGVLKNLRAAVQEIERLERNLSQ